MLTIFLYLGINIFFTVFSALAAVVGVCGMVTAMEPHCSDGKMLLLGTASLAIACFGFAGAITMLAYVWPTW